MDIKLNNKDIHAAIRGFLQERNIVDSYTELNISFAVTRGATPGASAEVTIIEPDTATSSSNLSIAPKEAKSGLFNAIDDA